MTAASDTMPAEDRVLALWVEAATYTDDVAGQARLVVLAEAAGWHPAYLAARIGAALEARPHLVPDTIPILCRSCAQECARYTDGSWRHLHNDRPVEEAGCRNPDTVWAIDRDAPPAAPVLRVVVVGGPSAGLVRIAKTTDGSPPAQVSIGGRLHVRIDDATTGEPSTVLGYPRYRPHANPTTTEENPR